MNYISMFRGINVSGQKKIKMADLKLLYESLDLENVKTYLQSGHVVFEKHVSDEADLKIIIEKAIQKQYTLDVPVQIKASDALAEIINNCPFGLVDVEKKGQELWLLFVIYPFTIRCFSGSTTCVIA